MAKNTKEKILYAAFDIISEKGLYETNIKDIADKVGLVKSAIYRHFESKDDVWNSLVDMIEKHYSSHFGSVQNLPKMPSSSAELKALTLGMVNFTLHDEIILKTRKIILTEQFRDERVSALASRHFLFDTEKIFEELFSAMMQKGIIKKDDATALAFEYTAPITVLIHEYDRNHGNEAEILNKIELHIDRFIGRCFTE